MVSSPHVICCFLFLFCCCCCFADNTSPSFYVFLLSPSRKKVDLLLTHTLENLIVHCRRRKIRCEVAADDPQGRCVDCIKLRKECKYYPVDQQPPAEKKSSRQGSKGDTLPSGFPSAASTPSASGSRTDQSDTFFPQQSVSISPGPGGPTFDSTKFGGSQVPTFSPGRCEPVKSDKKKS